MDDVEGVDPRLVQHGAKLMLDLFQDGQKRLADSAAEMSRWLLASLLAVNSGGLAALLASADRLPVPIPATAAFLLGILFALGSGVAIQAHSIRASKYVGEAIGGIFPYAAGEPYEGTLEEAQAYVNGKAAEIRRGAWIPQALGWVSGACFAVGSIVASAALLS